MAGSLRTRGALLAGLLIVGWESSHAIAVWAPQTGDFLSWLFIAYGVYGMVFAVKGIRRGVRFLRGTSADDTPEYLYVVGNMRREVLRADAQVVLFLMGLFSLLHVSFFENFFIAAMFNIVFVMNANATLDDRLGKRMRQAQARQTRRAAEGVSKRKGR